MSGYLGSFRSTIQVAFSHERTWGSKPWVLRRDKAMTKLTELDPDAMTKDQLHAFADYFWTDVQVKLTPCDLINITIALARAEQNPIDSKDATVFRQLARKISRIRDEVAQ